MLGIGKWPSSSVIKGASVNPLVAAVSVSRDTLPTYETAKRLIRARRKQRTRKQ